MLRLQAELQEANEKFLVFKRNDFQSAVNYEATKLLRKYIDPIEQATKESMECFVTVIESMSKVSIPIKPEASEPK